jgi:RecA DNA recombination protein
MPLARAHLESLLRAKKLDTTLSHLRPPVTERPALPIGADLDAVLGGGLPRGELSEVAGPRSSGRTTLMCAALASATARGELAALVDALDRFDVESAAAAGVELVNLLWVRGQAASAEAVRAGTGGQDSMWRAVERAVKAFTLVLESRAFGLAVCDFADVPAPVLRRLPFTTWFRLARLIEGGHTVALVVGPERLGRSTGGVTVSLGEGHPARGDRGNPGNHDAPLRWRGASDRARLFDGVVPRVRVLGRR